MDKMYVLSLRDYEGLSYYCPHTTINTLGIFDSVEKAREYATKYSPYTSYLKARPFFDGVNEPTREEYFAIEEFTINTPNIVNYTVNRKFYN